MSIADDISGFGEEPSYRACSNCGKPTTKARCWECDLEIDAKKAHEGAARVAIATVPEDFAALRLDGSAIREQVKGLAMPIEHAARRILEARWVTCIGSSGLGKTSLIAACFVEAVTRARLDRAFFVTAEELASASAHHPRGAGEPDKISTALAAPLLAIDDVGGPDLKIDSSAVRKVVYRRHGRGQRTWITTGLSREQIIVGYDDGFARRLLERRVGTLVLHFGVAPRTE